jgi:hypothetical protein
MLDSDGLVGALLKLPDHWHAGIERLTIAPDREGSARLRRPVMNKRDIACSGGC